MIPFIRRSIGKIIEEKFDSAGDQTDGERAASGCARSE